MNTILTKRIIIKKIIILAESEYDFKYQSIFKDIKNIEVFHGTFLQLIKQMFSGASYYHIRYIKYKGLFLTFPRLLFIYFIAKVSKTKIIWTCHNIYEHKIPFKLFNKFLVYFLASISYKIIVFHKDLSTYLPNKVQNKIIVASFGNFKNHFKGLNKKNTVFTKEYNNWIEKNNILQLDFIYISAAKKSNLNHLIDNVKNTDLKTLIIAPNIDLNRNIKVYENIFFYNDFVSEEIDEILTKNNHAIGFIGHKNISVPTSIYMFASYRIPMIGLDYSPVNSILTDNEIGLITKENDFDLVTKKIKSNYLLYQKNLDKFLELNSWEQSSMEHKKLLESE